MHRISFNARSVEALMAEALLLQREARHRFAAVGSEPAPDPAIGAAVQAQAENAAVRVADAVRWLEAQRAHFAGELSLFRLRLQHRLPPGPLRAGEAELALLPGPLRELVETIERFALRLQAIEAEWRRRERPLAGMLARLRQPRDDS